MPGCSTQTGGINDAGLVGAESPDAGYLYDSVSGTSTAFPGAFITVPGNNGRVPGGAFQPNGTVVPLIREANGTLNTYPGYPGTALTVLLELNSQGTGVGYASVDFTSFFGFMRSPEGIFTRFDYPGAIGLGTFILGLNETGTAVGYTADDAETQAAGFLRRPNGTWDPFNIPGAQATIPFAINDSGTVAGGYRDEGGMWHGFVWTDGVTQTVDFPGAPDTNITGVNNNGVLVGNTFNSFNGLEGPFNGFIATPTPEPGSLTMVGMMVSAGVLFKVTGSRYLTVIEGSLQACSVFFAE